jgi:hypothetical protein
MAKKQTAQKKIFSNEEINEAIIAIPKMIAEWEKDDRRNKIGSIYATMNRWNRKGGGVKSSIGDVEKNIRSYENIIRRNSRKGYPIEPIQKLLESEKELLKELKSKVK